MEIFHISKQSDLKRLKENTTIVIGNFDGVHIGHQQLLKFAKSIENNNLAVVTFSDSLKRDAMCLTSINDKIKIFESIGVNELFIFEVNDNFKKISRSEFIESYLKVLNPKNIICGDDFTFGYKAQGNVSYLRNYFDNVFTLNFLKNENNEKISSSLIRNLIKEGKVEEAKEYLGRYYSVSGVVVHGRGEGKLLGFPTANLLLDFNYLTPKIGVYASFFSIGDTKIKCLTNVGYCPTLTNGETLTFENYLLDFNKEIYNLNGKIEFVKYLRKEYKFENSEQLINQLENDVKQAYCLLNLIDQTNCL